MSQDWINLNENHSSNYVTTAMPHLYPKGTDGFPVNRLKLVPSSRWASHIKILPQTGTSADLFVNGGRTDYYLVSNGFVKTFHLELTVKNNHGATAMNILPQYLIDRCEILGSSSENVISTIRPDQIYLQRIDDSYEKALRVNSSEGLDTATYNNDASLAAQGSRKYILELRTFINLSELNLNVFDNKIIFRITWSNKGCDLPASIQYIDSLIRVKGIALESSLQMQDLRLRRQGVNKYCFLECSQHDENIALTTNQNYEIKMSACNGYCAFQVVLIRNANPTFSQLNTYQAVSSIALLDRNSNIIGMQEDSQYMQDVENSNFKGHILSVKPNIYILSYCESPSLAFNGHVNGYTKFDSQQYLRFVTNGSITPGNFTVSIISYFYSTIEINNGIIKSYKN